MEPERAPFEDFEESARPAGGVGALLGALRGPQPLAALQTALRAQGATTEVLAAAAAGLLLVALLLLGLRRARRAPTTAKDGWEAEVSSISTALQACSLAESRLRSWRDAFRALVVLYPVCLGLAAAAAVQTMGAGGVHAAVAWVPFPWLSLPAPFLALLALRSVLAWRVKRVQAQRVDLAEKKRLKLLELKETLPVPFKEAVALLEKYDPQGDHTIFTDKSESAALQQKHGAERRELLSIVDALLNIRFCDNCKISVLSSLEPVKGKLAHYRKELHAAPVTDGAIYERHREGIERLRSSSSPAVEQEQPSEGEAEAEPNSEEGVRRRGKN